VANI